MTDINYSRFPTSAKSIFLTFLICMLRNDGYDRVESHCYYCCALSGLVTWRHSAGTFFLTMWMKNCYAWFLADPFVQKLVRRRFWTRKFVEGKFDRLNWVTSLHSKVSLKLIVIGIFILIWRGIFHCAWLLLDRNSFIKYVKALRPQWLTYTGDFVY